MTTSAMPVGSAKRASERPVSRYYEVYERAKTDPVGFWGDAAKEIDWYEKATTRTFAPRFLQTSPRGDSPCASLTLHLHQVGWRTCTSELPNMPGTQRTR